MNEVNFKRLTKNRVQKTLFIFIIFLEISSYSNAQTEFAPVGAKWYYSYYNVYNSQSHEYFTYESVKDTMLNGKNCRKLDIWFHFIKNDSVYYGFDLIYSDSQRVYYFYKNKFQLLYDFNVKVGDTLNLLLFNPNLPVLKDLPDTHYVKYRVSDTGTIIINNEHLKYYKLSFQKLDSLIEFSKQLIFLEGTITEKLGDSKFLFGELYSTLDMYPLYTNLLCYFDNKIQYHQFNFFSCENRLIAINDNTTEKNSILLYPNPANENLILELKTSKIYNKSNIKIVDILGHECMFNLVKINDRKYSINISELQAGTYFLIILDLKPIFQKLIKL